MDFSIIIPVFNREDLTRNCLQALPATIAGAGTGEVIVVDNGSRPETAAVVAEFPWVRYLRNEANLGFAAACNRGARAATGTYLVHLNNDTIPLDCWLEDMLAVAAEPGVGIVGARLLYPNRTIQHAGVMLFPARFGPEGAGPFHFLIGKPGNSPDVLVRTDFEAVTGACLVTPRALYDELGGFDEAYWNGYEDVDYCYKVRAHGLRVVYEPSAVLYHYESQSGVQRKRRVAHNLRELATRWSMRVAPDHNRLCGRIGYVRREVFRGLNRTFVAKALAPATAIVHGPAPTDADALLATLLASEPKPRIVWAAEGPPPRGIMRAVGGPIDVAHDLTELRADGYIAFVDTRTQLEATWLGELIDSVEYASDICAATVVPPGERTETSAPLAVDARCTLVAPRQWPQDLRIDRSFATLDGALADWSYRAVERGRSVRAVPRPIARLGPPVDDAVFTARYGMGHDVLRRPDPARLEALSASPTVLVDVFVSIVMLSWNAPQYTKLAVDSIRRNTTTVAHEIIIVDNGSNAETVAMLRELTDVRVIYNPVNTGFAHGCNQGIGASSGTHVVLLNNDVLVNPGWLDRLLDAHRRDPLVGVSAPVSNAVAGDQKVNDTTYNDEAGMLAYAARRASLLRERHYRTDRAIGFCLCIARRVIDEVGGIDERYGTGNFEDDDYSLRVRAAGYEIVVCEDVFIHHFGSVSFTANNVDYMATMQKNWSIFAERWNLPRAYPVAGYSAEAAIARGFDRAQHYVPVHAPVAEVGPASAAAYELAFVALVDDEASWSRLGSLVANYARALTPADRTVLMLGVLAPLDATTIAGRVERALGKVGVAPDVSPDIDITDIDDVAVWRSAIVARHVAAFDGDERLPDIAVCPDRSPSGIRRFARAHAVSA